MAGKIDAPKVERATILPKAGLQLPNEVEKKDANDVAVEDNAGDNKAMRACRDRMEASGLLDPRRAGAVGNKYVNTAAEYRRQVERACEGKHEELPPWGPIPHEDELR